MRFKNKSKNRRVNTHFWDDSYIEALSSHGKLLYLYLITTPHTNIAGSFEITIAKIRNHTEIPKEEVQELLIKFEEDGKLEYRDNWMFVFNTIEHQDTTVSTIVIGQRAIINASPQWVRERVTALYPWLDLDSESLGVEVDRLSVPSNSLSTDHGQSPSNLNLNLNINTKSKKREGSVSNETPRTAKRKSTDPRSEHAAITAVRELTNRFPPKGLWDRLIEVLGEKPDTRKLKRCYEEWIGRGFNETNYLGWTVDWYLNGISPSVNGRPAARETFASNTDDAPDEPIKTLRPLRPAKVPNAELKAWLSATIAIKKQIGTPTFNTWFNAAALVFDGFDKKNRLIKLRAHPVTKEWLESYYSEVITDALAGVGVPGMKIKWEVEEAEYD